MGYYLTIEYLKMKGLESELIRYKESIADKKLFSKWLKKLRAELNSLYALSNNISKKKMLENKQKIIENFTKNRKPKFSYADYVSGKNWNNAGILAHALYDPNFERFLSRWHVVKNEEYRCLSRKA